MKITFLQDLDPLVTSGGAQATDRLIIREAWRRGHEVEIVVPETFRAGETDADLLLVSNSTRFNPALLRSERTVVFVHDYYWCRFRLYFPLQEKCKSCPYLDPWRSLLSSARLNVFMSPLHRDACFSVIPELSGLPHVLCPSLLDPKGWTAPDGPRTAGEVLGVNSLVPYKGRENVLRYARDHPDRRFSFAGAAEGEGDLPPNARWLGPVNDKELRRLYGCSESFIHLPGTPQPSERTVIEARLSGCRLILNPMVGVTSYPEWRLPDGEFRKWLSERPAELWREIEAN